MSHKLLYIKINDAQNVPSSYDNKKWFFMSAFHITELDLSVNKFLSTEKNYQKILQNINNHRIILFGSIPFPAINFDHLQKLRTSLGVKIGIIFGDTIQSFPNYLEYYTQFIDYAICAGEDDCNHFETAGIPTFHSSLLYDDCAAFSEYPDVSIPSSKRKFDLIHIGRLDCGHRAEQLESIKNLPIKVNYFGKKKATDKYTPTSELIKCAQNTKIAIVFSQPNSERSFSSNKYLWERRTQNKGSLTQLMSAGCVVVAEYQPYLFKNYQVGKHFLLKEIDFKNQILKLLNNPNTLDYIQKNAAHLMNIKLNQREEIEKINVFMDNILTTNYEKSYEIKSFIVDYNYKYNFIKFNRPYFRSKLFRVRLYKTNYFSKLDVLFYFGIYALKKIYSKFKNLLHSFFSSSS
jgi:hypothetical protein